MSRSEVTHEEAGSQFYSRAESHTTNNTSRSLPDPKFARTWTRSEDWERTTEDFNQVEGVKVGKVNKKRNSIFGNTLQPSKRIYESASSLSPMVSTRNGGANLRRVKKRLENSEHQRATAAIDPRAHEDTDSRQPGRQQGQISKTREERCKKQSKVRTEIERMQNQKRGLNRGKRPDEPEQKRSKRHSKLTLTPSTNGDTSWSSLGQKKRIQKPRSSNVVHAQDPEVFEILDDSDDNDGITEGVDVVMSDAKVSPLRKTSSLKRAELQLVEVILIGNNHFDRDRGSIRVHADGFLVEVSTNAKSSVHNLQINNVKHFRYSQKIVKNLYRVVQLVLNEESARNINDSYFQYPFPNTKNPIGEAFWLLIFNDNWAQFVEQIKKYCEPKDTQAAIVIENQLWTEFSLNEREALGLETVLQQAHADALLSGPCESRVSLGVRRSSRTQGAPTRFMDQQGKCEFGLASPRRCRHRKSRGDAKPMFRYPIPSKDGERPRVTITDADLERCDNDFLNDNLIDFSFMKLMRERFQLFQEDVHVFPSFFYTRFLQGMQNNKRNRAGSPPKCKYDSGFEYVQNWAKKGDIFKKKFLVVPVNKDLHWSLLIVCNPGHLRSDPSESEPFCMIHLDSLGCHNSSDITKNLLQYLVRAWKQARLGLTEDHITRRNLVRPECIPKQTNSSDCGVYILLYFEHFFMNAAAGGVSLSSVTTVDKLDNLRKYGVGDGMKPWFSQREVVAKRMSLKEQIYFQHQKYKKALQRMEEESSEADYIESPVSKNHSCVPGTTTEVASDYHAKQECESRKHNHCITGDEKYDLALMSKVAQGPEKAPSESWSAVSQNKSLEEKNLNILPEERGEVSSVDSSQHAPAGGADDDIDIGNNCVCLGIEQAAVV